MLLSTLRHLFDPPLQLDEETLKTGRILSSAQITGLLYFIGLLVLLMGICGAVGLMSLPPLHTQILLGLGAFQLLSAWVAGRVTHWARMIWGMNLIAYQFALLGVVFANPEQQQILFSTIFPILAGFLTLSRNNGFLQTLIALGIPFILKGLEQPIHDSTFWLNYTLFILVGAAVSLFLHVLIHRYIRETHALLTRLEKLALQDPLTGALNRRGFFQKGEAIFALHHRATLPLTLVVIDLDYFKRVNDTYGHEAGDAVLKKVVMRLKHTFKRKSDLVSRLDGDELALILSNTPLEQACPLLNQFANYLQHHPIEFKGVKLPVALSMGCAAMDPEQHHTLKELVKEADQAVYRAKGAGRSHICFGLKGQCIKVDTFFTPPHTAR